MEWTTILVDGLLYEVKWSSRIKNYYVNKGYVFTGKDQPFMVDVNDLNHKSTISVNAKCDECGSDMKTPIFLHYKRYESGAPDLCKCCAAKLGHKNVWKKRSERWFNKLEEIMYTKVLMNQGLSKDQIASYFKVKPGRSYYMMEAARKMNDSVLKDLINRITELDYKIKSGLIDKRLGFQLFLLGV